MKADGATPEEVSVVLIDQPLSHDRRAQRAMSALPGKVVVVDVSEARPSALERSLHYLRALWYVARSATAARRRREVAKHLRPLQRNPLAGLAACYRHTLTALAGARAVAKVAEHARLHTVYANDLTAALSALWSGACDGAHFVYDAHELELHRNRRIGWCRLLVEHAQEQQVVCAAQEVITVCRPIQERMQALHPRHSATFRVLNNDFFQHHPVVAPSSRDLAIVYVGVGARGRQLAALEQLRQEAQLAVHAWLLSEAVTLTVGQGHWQNGSTNYEPELLALARLRRCLMWCCVDARPMSYRLALPNKFFQALAVGMPIIASRGSYLAELVERFQIGAVLEDTSPKQLRATAQSDTYATWASNVVSLRSRLRSGELSL